MKIHEAKLEALAEIVDTTDSPVLVFYSYKHDLAAIQGKIKGARILENEKDISDWNAGKVQVLLAHPASVGYGLNLQEGGHVIVWYGLTWPAGQRQAIPAGPGEAGDHPPPDC